MQQPLFCNATVVTPVDSGALSSGGRQGFVHHIPQGGTLIKEWDFEAVCPEAELTATGTTSGCETINLEGNCVVPGLWTRVYKHGRLIARNTA